MKLKSRCPQGSIPSGNFREGSDFFSFLDSRGHLHSLTLVPFPVFKEHHFNFCFLISYSSLTLTLLLPFYKDPYDYIGST